MSKRARIRPFQQNLFFDAKKPPIQEKHYCFQPFIYKII